MGEAGLVDGVEVCGADSLAEVAAWLRGEGESARPRAAAAAAAPDRARGQALARLAALDGLALARKAAVIAAVGRHNLLMVGPPGAGKTRLARLIGDLQTDLEGGQALEVTRIHSAAGLLAADALVRRRPFRAPHHTMTRAGLIGGGGALRPGEVTLAHQGILFLDELAEFPPTVLDALREPLEEGSVSLVRGYGPLHLSGAVPAGGRHQSLPLRLSGRDRPPLPVHAGGAPPLPGPPLGSAAGPLRSLRRGGILAG